MPTHFTLQRLAVGFCTLAMFAITGCQPTKSQATKKRQPAASETATENSLRDSVANKSQEVNDSPASENQPLPPEDDTESTGAEETSVAQEAPPTPTQNLQEPPPASAANAADPERVIVLAETGPVICDFYIQVDGISHHASINALIEDVLKTGDSNQDGQTTWKEILSNDRFVYGQYGNPQVDSEQQRVELAKSYDINSNNYVDRDEVLGFLRQDTSNNQFFYLNESANQSETVSSSPIFKWLDTNKDDLLDEFERTAAVQRIWKIDAEDDRIIRPGDFGTNNNGMNRRRRRRTRPPRKTLVLREYTNWSKLLYAVEERYAYGNPLTVHDIPDSSELFEQLDADQDEYLTPREFSEIASVPPHVSITIRFGAEPYDRISVIESGRSLAIESITVKDEQVNLNVAGSLIELTATEPNVEDAINRQVAAAFQQFDLDKDGSFSEQEYGALQGIAQAPFAIVDANSDKKIERNELESSARVRQMAQRSQIAGNVGASQQPLFGQLDVNGDGQLTTREVDQIAHRLLLLDENGDGIVAPNEKPNSIIIQLTRGAAVAPNAVDPQTTSAPSVEQSGPSWFRSMDVNRDGEISRREFIGPLASFDALDEDADQFVTLAEATAAE